MESIGHFWTRTSPSVHLFAGHISEASLQEPARTRLIRLDAATSLQDLRAFRGNRLEALSGRRKGQFSIRINDQIQNLLQRTFVLMRFLQVPNGAWLFFNTGIGKKDESALPNHVLAMAKPGQSPPQPIGLGDDMLRDNPACYVPEHVPKIVKSLRRYCIVAAADLSEDAGTLQGARVLHEQALISEEQKQNVCVDGDCDRKREWVADNYLTSLSSATYATSNRKDNLERISLSNDVSSSTAPSMLCPARSTAT
jgi:hypothetical protein